MANGSKRGITFVLAATFLFWVSLYLYVPVLPLHAADLGANLTTIGIVVAAYAIGQVILRVPIGIAADIYGHKPFAVVSLLLASLGALWLGLAEEPWALFTGRTVTGIAAAGWVVISVLCVSYFRRSPTENAMTIIMSINTSAILVATLLGGMLADHFGNRSVFFLAAGIGAIGGLLMSSAPKNSNSSKSNYSRKRFIKVIKTPLLLQVSGVAIIMNFVTFGITFGFLPILANDLGASKSEVGYIATSGLASMVVGTIFTRWIVSFSGVFIPVVIATLFIIISVAFMPLTTSVMLLIVLQLGNGFGRGLLNTILIGLAMDSVDVKDRATAMGSYQAVYAVGMLLGPLLSGIIAEQFGVASVFWVASLITLVGLALTIRGPMRQQ